MPADKGKKTSDSNQNPKKHDINEVQKDDKEKSVLVNQLKLVNEQVSVLGVQIEDWKSKYIRQVADMQNLSKQHELDISHAKKSGKKTIISTLSTFINTLNLAFTFAPRSGEPDIIKFITTLNTSFQRLIEDLKLNGVEIIIPGIGSEFDAALMNILNPNGIYEATDKITVKQVVSCGIRIDNQLIQPANVMI